jgi:hypothetical protein
MPESSGAGRPSDTPMDIDAASGAAARHGVCWAFAHAAMPAHPSDAHKIVLRNQFIVQPLAFFGGASSHAPRHETMLTYDRQKG